MSPQVSQSPSYILMLLFEIISFRMGSVMTWLYDLKDMMAMGARSRERDGDSTAGESLCGGILHITTLYRLSSPSWTKSPHILNLTVGLHLFFMFNIILTCYAFTQAQQNQRNQNSNHYSILSLSLCQKKSSPQQKKG